MGVRDRFRRSGWLLKYATSEQALRSELFSAAQMERHGKDLAGAHKLDPRSAPDQLVARLKDNELVLVDICKLLIATLSANRRISPAGEWLLDNFHLIEEQISTAKKHFPKTYSRELPRLLSGASAGLPRVYDIALEVISHGDGRVDLDSLSRFIAAYQSVAPLNLGELWAIPIMLRLALIENLRRVGSHIGAHRAIRDLANSWADKMIEIAERDPKSLILVIADMARSNPPMVSSFVAELARRLQGHGPALALPLTWIEQRLAESGQTTEQMVQSETMQQVADQASISNSIGSLRLLGATDWRDFVESESIVEQTLRRDPTGVYAKMTFATRDHYRHVIERMAKYSVLSEVDIAIRAIELASAPAADVAGSDRTGHVGYYLIDKGVPELERRAEVRKSAGKQIQRLCAHHVLLLYLGGIATITLMFTGALFRRAGAASLPDWQMTLVAVALFLIAFELAIAIANRIATALAIPRSLPRIDFMEGVPEDNKTLVVVPTLLGDARNVENLLEALEVRFLANSDKYLRFGLLTDFRDAKTQTLPSDESIMSQAKEGIEALNQKYVSDGSDRFFLFHRPRVWVAEEDCWMAYERKRGKLSALNALLRGKVNGFSVVVGDTKSLTGVKYVVTLDTDTQLPRDAVRQFVGTMAHPLNRPRYDETKQLIGEGYGILQPRMAISLPGANKSRFSRLHGGEPGIDPYTRVVSDVYQDLFDEGSFIGKGIYEIDAFEFALGDRFPDNRILSHDLLEGCYARSGLLSDVELYEDYPSRYTSDLSRRHRWIRGDWQLLDWLLPSVPLPGKARQANPLSLLSRWKIFDNFRRSVTTPAFLLLFLLSWTVFTPPLVWTALALLLFTLPCFLSAGLDLSRRSSDVHLEQHLRSVFRSAKLHLGQAAFSFACLPCDALSNLDAICRTLWRLMVTHKHLLEWSTAADTAAANSGAGLASFIRIMCAAPAISAGVMLYLLFYRPLALLAALPILIVWLASPLIAWWMSRPLKNDESKLTALQTIFLYKIARKTWAFFVNVVGPEDNWLPPDNLQESPVERLAHRTSPTNMGLALLANLSAHNFGYITCATLIERTKNAFNTMSSLERHRGHFLNWYDTLTLKPLMPAYISTVDSGNLSGHLLTLRPGLQALGDQQIVDGRIFYGLRDTLNVLHDTITATIGSQPDTAEYRKKAETLVNFQKELESACKSPPKTLAAIYRNLTQISGRAAEVARSYATTVIGEEAIWVNALEEQCQNTLGDLLFLVPWITLQSPSGELAEVGGLDDVPTLRQLAALDLTLAPILQQRLDSSATPEEKQWLVDIKKLTAEASQRASTRIETVEQLALQAGEFAQIEYDFLYDKTRRLLSIGYNVSDRRLDQSYYDLLASEARLCNFIAIAEGQLPQESWFALGRLLTATTGGDPVLFSWSGSMFEYLMPLLVMPTYDNTLLDRTYKAEVKRQIEYGRQRGVPWGISESGYNLVDGQQNYQYHPFGVPGLGLKRGLADDVVIAPYATALALMVDPEAACQNLQTLSADGFEGRFGFFEAIDYTPSRLPPGHSHVVVKSFMAHHQGMTLLSLAYALLDKPMQKLFESDLAFKATLPLLQERLPEITDFHWHTSDISGLQTGVTAFETPMRVFTSPDTPIPEVQLLSNGRYNVMISNSGGGYSRWADLAVTRWREDATCDNWGSFCYVRDVDSGEFWSSTYQPTLKRPDKYEAIFSEARVEFRRHDHDIDTHSEIVVSSEDDIELRKIRLTNRSWTRRTIEVTSYAEVVLAPAVAEALHPAFSNLFVQTELVEQRHAILCNRRPRSVDEQPPWLFHLMEAYGGAIGQVSYETDRCRFLGRGRTTLHPEAMDHAGPLSGTNGSVLDPIVAIRYRITLAPAESTTIYMVTGIGGTREASLGLVEKYRDKGLSDRVFDLAWTHGQVVLRQLNATDTEGQLYCRLANSIIYTNPTLRADANTLIKNRRGQSGLWGYSISGDLPIVLVQIRNPAAVELVRQLIQAHAYWRIKGLQADLVIWNEDSAGYRQLLQEQIMDLIAGTTEAHVIDKPGGIFVRTADQIAPEDRVLLQSVARAILSDTRGTLEEQVNRRGIGQVRVPRLTGTSKHTIVSTGEPPTRDLILRNGLGGFTPDGREYVITTRPGQTTPAPWVNVLANPYFGTVISENGVSYTWAENAHEYRLTPWHNDPVSDASGEALYIRDEESGHFWSPSPLPRPGIDPYVSRHGFGYSVFEHNEGGIVSELTVFVALDAPVKFSVLKLRNNSGRARKLSATGYVEWVLADMRSKSTMHTVTEIDPKSGALFARNSYNTEFAERVSFFDVDDVNRTLTGDRTEFIGRNGTLSSPQALGAQRLSNKVGAAFDPCAAIQVHVDLADGQEKDIVFRLGSGRDAEDASTLVHRFRGSGRHASFERTCEYWKHTLGTVNVQTPDDSLNMLTNGWLLYQTIACRVWGRSGYYQSGGAFGFRDQLQDVMALIHAEPRIIREQLLRCASRQFLEGDVQHWWHPPAGRGVRTHCSDDYLWLPLATCRYVSSTGDTGVLDEQVNFLDGRKVNPEEDSYYDLPARSEQTSTLYDHCVRAITRGLNFGEHGLPLMGGGDWNDGMNLVGHLGKGESVWLAFFLIDVLSRFSQIARLRGDQPFVELCLDKASEIRQNVEKNAWDGEWYKRAYFDDGTPLGSAQDPECQIDSIAQSWSILSGAAPPDHALSAMNALEARLVRRNDALVQLLDPPFDKSDLNPGYIKGYLPGVRENGGQYTHAAIWAAMAFAAMEDNSRAWQLLNMINPVNHARSAADVATYKVEPYVVAGDVYAVAPHTGRGGWTWYTGSAGWLYRLIVESLLGLRLDINKITFAPCFPIEWQEFKVHYRFRETVYHITVMQDVSAERSSVIVDGACSLDDAIHLEDDRREHFVEVRMWAKKS